MQKGRDQGKGRNDNVNFFLMKMKIFLNENFFPKNANLATPLFMERIKSMLLCKRTLFSLDCGFAESEDIIEIRLVHSNFVVILL